MALKIERDGKEYVVRGGTETLRFKTADDALDYVNEQQAKAEAERSKPVSFGITKRGQFTANVNDRDRLGNYPLFNLTGNGMRALIAAWPEAVAQFEAAEKAGKIVSRWQDLPKAEKSAS